MNKSVIHCKDCCCARLWAVLGISEFTGKSLVEHVQELKDLARPVHFAQQTTTLSMRKQESESGSATSSEAAAKSIGAATAEVKKEGSLGSETPATTGVVSEQTGLAPCPFCGKLPKVTEYPGLGGHKAHPDFDLIRCLTAHCPASHKAVYRDRWNKRAASQSAPSQTPTDTRRETATCLAAPSRKQKTDEEIAHAFAVNISNIGLLDTGRPFVEDAAKEILTAIRESAAARVEPTKEEKE